MFRKIDKTSTFNDVLKQIIENIQNGELQPGDALPAERILAEEFGISRPALREVLKALSLLGITVSVHGGANYIATDLHSCLTTAFSYIVTFILSGQIVSTSYFCIKGICLFFLPKMLYTTAFGVSVPNM